MPDTGFLAPTRLGRRTDNTNLYLIFVCRRDKGAYRSRSVFAGAIPQTGSAGKGHSGRQRKRAANGARSPGKIFVL